MTEKHADSVSSAVPAGLDKYSIPIPGSKLPGWFLLSLRDINRFLIHNLLFPIMSNNVIPGGILFRFFTWHFYNNFIPYGIFKNPAGDGIIA